MSDSNESALQESKRLFDSNNLKFVGQGFYRYTETISEEMISRKGLEREVSKFMSESVTLLTRHDVDNTLSLAGVPASERVAVLQISSHYEKDQERILKSKTAKLQIKYQK